MALMPGIRDITNVWENLEEVDLRPIRAKLIFNPGSGVAGVSPG